MTSPEKLATPETVRKALQRAYSLGQIYWQQADSESFSQNRKADETAAKFQALVEETVACVLATQRQGEGETQPDKKLWLWKNFVDGRPEYWAFDNPYPCRMDCWDPQTLGEPCGYALFKPSREGRTDWTEEKVLRAFKNARPSKD